MLSKEKLSQRYERLYKQLQKLIIKTDDIVSQMATMTAVLHHKMPDFFWTGFYILKNNRLVVGPYQGPLACQVLSEKKGACWAGILKKKTIIIPDVHKFPGHIACDNRSNSEIIVPLINKNGSVWAVLDIDSRNFNSFSEIDKDWLEKTVNLI